MTYEIGELVDGVCVSCGARNLVAMGFGEVECKRCELPQIHPYLRDSDSVDIKVGERYVPDELPDNDMDPHGNLEWVSDDVLSLAHDGKIYEFKMAVECTAIAEITEDGRFNTIDGELS